MREYQNTVQEHLQQGLRPSESLPDDAPFWVQKRNIASRKFGLERPELVTPSVHRKGQIFSSSEYLIVFEGELLVVYGRAGNIVTTADVALGPWDCVAIGPYFIAMNGDQIVTIDPTSRVVNTSDALSNTPCGRTMCDANGQLIIGAPITPWHDCGDNAVIYSRIGDIDCTVDHSNEAGFVNLPTSGAVKRVCSIGPGIVAGTDDGIFYLTPPSELPGFAVNKVIEYPILSERAVSSDDKRAVVATSNGVYTIMRDGSVEELGFKYLFNQDTEVHYGCRDNTFYLTTCGKTYCLFGNELFESAQQIESVCHWKGEAVGIVPDMGDFNSWALTTHSLSFGNTSLKTLRSVEILGSLDGNHEARLRVWWKTNKSSWIATPWKPLYPEAMTVPNISGVKFRLEICGRYVQNRPIQISKITTRFKTTDRRFIRGATGATGIEP